MKRKLPDYFSHVAPSRTSNVAAGFSLRIRRKLKLAATICVLAAICTGCALVRGIKQFDDNIGKGDPPATNNFPVTDK